MSLSYPSICALLLNVSLAVSESKIITNGMCLIQKVTTDPHFFKSLKNSKVECCLVPLNT